MPRLLAARVPAAFHRRVHLECVRRRMSLTQLVDFAFRLTFNAPVDRTAKPGLNERRALDDIWLRYMHTMPREKVEVMVKAMEWDLSTHKSARRR